MHAISLIHIPSSLFTIFFQWKNCHNCKQYYRNELALDLADEFESYIVAKYPGCPCFKLEGLYLKIVVIYTSKLFMTPVERTKAKKIAKRAVSTFQRIPSPQPQSLRILSYTYNLLGELYLQEEKKESYEVALEWFEKDLVVSTTLGEEIDSAKNNIERAKAAYEGRNQYIHKGSTFEDLEDSLGEKRETYLLEVKKYGEEKTISSGMNLCHALKVACHTIEAQRLATKLVSVSRQIHGEDHAVTKETEEYLSGVKRRYVAFLAKRQIFEAIRYEEGDNKLVIQGPLQTQLGVDWTKHRNTEAEETFTIPTYSGYTIIPGTPIICHSLEGELSPLNGKIGEIRPNEGNKAHDWGIGAKIHFEDEDVKPIPFDERHVRIVFELP